MHRQQVEAVMGHVLNIREAKFSVNICTRIEKMGRRNDGWLSDFER
jgi:hypothetical protein